MKATLLLTSLALLGLTACYKAEDDDVLAQELDLEGIEVRSIDGGERIAMQVYSNLDVPIDIRIWLDFADEGGTRIHERSFTFNAVKPRTLSTTEPIFVGIDYHCFNAYVSYGITGSGDMTGLEQIDADGLECGG